MTTRTATPTLRPSCFLTPVCPVVTSSHFITSRCPNGLHRPTPTSPLYHRPSPLMSTISSSSSSSSYSSTTSSNTHTHTQSTITLPDARVPRSVRSSGSVIIVGGGAVGSLAAAALSSRGVPVILLDTQPDFLQFDVHRAYSLGLHGRGIFALRAVPGLYDHLAQHWISLPLSQLRENSDVTKGQQVSLVMRFRLLHALRQFVETRTSVTALYGRKVTGVAFEQDGRVRMTVVSNNNNNNSGGAGASGLEKGGQGEVKGKQNQKEEEVLYARLVLACDGRRSSVVQALRDSVSNSTTKATATTPSHAPNTAHSHTDTDTAASAPVVSSTHGFNELMMHSPAVGVKVRSLVLSPAVIDHLPLSPSPTFSEYMAGLRGRPTNSGGVDAFTIHFAPMTSADIAHLGGVLGVIVQQPDHALWRLSATDVEAAYNMFEKNFPDIANMRDLIALDQMAGFLGGRPASFPPVGRPASLAAVIGHDNNTNSDVISGSSTNSERGAVVLLGDAAHWFPPDCGQGVNAGLEDVTQLMTVLHWLPDDASLADVASAYERARTTDVDALLRIVRLVSRQFALPKVVIPAVVANMVTRARLAAVKPEWFSPPVTHQLSSTTPYRTVLQGADATTSRLVVGVAFGVGLMVSWLMMSMG